MDSLLIRVTPGNRNPAKTIRFQGLPEVFPSERLSQLSAALFPIMDNMSDASGLCLQDLVHSQGQAASAGVQNAATNGQNNGQNDHLHNHHSSLHDSVAAAVSVSSAITGLMSGGAGAGSLGHLHHHSGHDLSGHHHHHHHHNLGPHTPSLHEPLEKLKSKSWPMERQGDQVSVSLWVGESINKCGCPGDKQPERCD